MVKPIERGEHWRSVICRLDCGHHHNEDGALLCAATRIKNGELSYYFGKDMPILISDKELRKYIKKFNNKSK